MLVFYSGNFTIVFDEEYPKSQVFQIMERACIVLMKESQKMRRMQSTTHVGSILSRMLWRKYLNVVVVVVVVIVVVFVFVVVVVTICIIILLCIVSVSLKFKSVTGPSDGSKVWYDNMTKVCILGI